MHAFPCWAPDELTLINSDQPLPFALVSKSICLEFIDAQVGGAFERLQFQHAFAMIHFFEASCRAAKKSTMPVVFTAEDAFLVPTAMILVPLAGFGN
jgi:hypothetical protein